MPAIENRIGIIIGVVVFACFYGFFVYMFTLDSGRLIVSYNNTTSYNTSLSDTENANTITLAFVNNFFNPSVYGDLGIIAPLGSAFIIAIMVEGIYITMVMIRGN